MESLKELYIIGPGPSSSHTIGPYKASLDFIKDIKSNSFNVSKIEITLKGSLALTGKGHFTDKIILDTLKEYNPIVSFDYSLKDLKHPNTLVMKGLDNKNNILIESIYYSVGGGKILKNKLENKPGYDIYPLNKFNDIKTYLKMNKIKDLKEFVDTFEDSDINEYLNNIVDTMFKSVEDGLSREEKIPGLGLERVSKKLYENSLKLEGSEKVNMLLTSFAYAVSENNACGEMIVTAPTCGSAGIIPSILYYEEKINKVSRSKIIDALKVGGIIGNLAKKNASISGAIGGCQAEIGVASAMGAAIFAYINNLSIYQIEYASEVALEHFLGLTCDPVKGYVQIPCIERNGIGVLRSYNSYLYSKNIAPLRKNKVSYDEVVETMKITGNDLSSLYKETSEGGLAKIIK